MPRSFFDLRVNINARPREEVERVQLDELCCCYCRLQRVTRCSMDYEYAMRCSSRATAGAASSYMCFPPSVEQATFRVALRQVQHDARSTASQIPPRVFTYV